MIKHLALITIVLLALVLRMWNLGGLPSGFHNDEVMNGYVGRFTLQNGVDLYGNKWPLLYFNNFGDYPNILPMYLSGLSTYIFGVNEFAVRFPIALAGVVAVYLAYLLSELVFKNKHIALWSAFALAVSPWHIVLSRATAEGITASMVFLLGLIFMLHRRYLFMTIAFLLTYFLYPSFRILVPLALLPTFLLVKPKKQKIVLVGITLFFFLLTLGISQTTWGKGRYDQTSVFAFNDVIKTRLVQAAYQDTGVPLFITRMFHNKLWAAGREIANQYFQYWSGSFLFVRGGLPPRYTLPDHGVELISFMLIGLLALTICITRQGGPLSPHTRYFLYLLLISPLPAALTMEDTPNVHRAILMALFLAILFGWLIHYVLTHTFFMKKLLLVSIFGFFLYESVYFGHEYVTHATVTQAASRHNEMKDVSSYIINNQASYDAVYAPTIAHLPLHYLFHANIFDASLAGKFGQNSVIRQVGTVYFSAEQCPSDFLDYKALAGRVLIVDRVECGDKPFLKTLLTIKRADGYDAYTIKSFSEE